MVDWKRRLVLQKIENNDIVLCLKGSFVSSRGNCIVFFQLTTQPTENDSGIP